MNEFDSNGMNLNNDAEPVMIPDNEVEVNQGVGMEEASTVKPTFINPEPEPAPSYQEPVAPVTKEASSYQVPVEPAPVQVGNVPEPNPTPITPAPMEEAKEEMEQPQNQNVNVVVNVEQPKRKRHVFRTIFNTLFTLVVLTILANAILAVVNFNQLANEKAPYIFTESSVKTEDGNTYHTYPQGLFKVVHAVTESNETWSLKPFFMN